MKQISDGEFVSDLNKIVLDEYSKIRELINNDWGKLIEFKFFVDGGDEFNKKFGLNKSIQFVITINKYPNEQKCGYYYKGRKIEPDCYYNRPNNYYQPTIVEQLQECIKQDSYKPNIKHLENKYNETN